MAGKPSSRGWTLALTSVAFFMVALDVLVVSTAMPAIQRDLHAGLAALEWTVNAYGLTYAAGIITAAALGDRLGRRRVFTGGLVLFAVSSAACALAPSASVLIAARAVQGIGAAVIMPLSLTILTTAFPAERRGAVLGVWGGIAGLAVASGPVIGGAMTQGLNWHWIFWVNVPVGLIAAALAVARLCESHGRATRLDLPAVALVSGGALGIVWGLVRGNAVGWGSGEVGAALGLGGGLMVCFVVWERRAVDPMLPPKLFQRLSFSGATGSGFLMMSALTGGVFLIAQYFQLVLGFSPLGAGLHMLPWTATAMLIAPVAGALADWLGHRAVLVAGLLMQGVGLMWIALAATVDSAYPGLVAPLIVAGVGVSMAVPVVPAAVMGAVPPADLGKASGANSTLQRFGGAFGVAIATAVFAAYGGLSTPATFNAGFRPALAVCGALSALGAFTALTVRKRTAPPTEQPKTRAA